MTKIQRVVYPCVVTQTLPVNVYHLTTDPQSLKLTIPSGLDWRLLGETEFVTGLYYVWEMENYVLSRHPWLCFPTSMFPTGGSGGVIVMHMNVLSERQLPVPAEGVQKESL